MTTYPTHAYELAFPVRNTEQTRYELQAIAEFENSFKTK